MTTREGDLYKKLLVSIAVFIKEIDEHGFKMWTQVREEEGPLYGKLEFPGGKIELGETPRNAMIREVFEEVGVDIKDFEAPLLFKIQDYLFNNKSISLYVYVSRFDQLPKDKGQWLQIDYQNKSAPFKGKIPEINHVFIDELAVYIQQHLKDNLLDLAWKSNGQY
jgi:8-oxo-dGTP diphosphatase